MARLRSAKAAPSPAPTTTEATRRPILREKTNTMAAATPGPGAEKSMLALKNFKRRPRQSSVLELVKHRRSSVAASQSLAASVIQQHQQEDEGAGHENTSVFDLGSASEDDEEVFAPEAEGTPVHLDKKKTRVSGSARKTVEAAESGSQTASAVKKNKRKSGDLEDSSHSALDALRKKHRKSEPSHLEEEHSPGVDHSNHSAGHVSPDHQTSPVIDRTASEVQVINSSPQHSSPLTSPASSRGFPGPAEADFTVPSTEEQERARKNLDDPEDEDEDEADSPDFANATMAEPASSSPITSPIPETQRTDIYADPMTQASPSPPREPARTRSQNNNNDKKKQPASLSTAKLRALLPRRTQKPQPRPRRTDYDIPSDEDEDDDGTALGTTNSENDEDEDDFRNSRSRRQTKTATQSKSSKMKPTTATATSASTRAAKSKSAPQPNRSKSKATRQYGRAAAASASDKENAGEEPQDDEEGEEEEGEDTTLTMKDIAHSRELEEARRKFAEVDEWDLSFESMSNEDHRSSSQNWR